MSKGVKLLDAYVEVTADGSNIVGDVKKQVDADSGKAKGSGLGIGKALVGGIVGSIAVAQIGSFLGDSISKSSDLNETINKSQAIFGAQSGAMEKWASKAATTLGLSKGAALDAAASFGDMFTQIGFTGDAAADMSKSVVTAAADLGSFSNLDTADVSDRIAAAMRGEYDSLQAVIPNINAARVESEALAATGKTTAKELTAQEKATAVMAIVTKDGARAMGDFSKTSDSLANRQKIAAAQTEDLQAAIGTGLAPVVNTLMGVFVNNILPVLQQFATWISQNTAIMAPLAIALGIVTVAIWAANSAMLANPVTWVILGIAALIAAIVLLVMNWDNVVKFLTDVWGGFMGWISDGIKAFVSWWNGIWAAVGARISSVWQGFVNFILAVWNGYVGTLRAIVGALLGWWNGIWASFGATISSIWGGIVSGVSGAINGVVGFIGGIQGKVLGILSGAAGWLVSVGGDIVRGLWSGISGAWDWLLGMFRDLIGGIVDVAKAMLGIHSPSTVFADEVGDQIPAGVGVGIKRGNAKLARDFRSTLDVGLGEVRGGGASGGQAPQSGDNYYFGDITLDVSKMQEISSVVDLMKSIGQSARQGRGIRTTAGTLA